MNKHIDGALRAAEALWEDGIRFGPFPSKADQIRKHTTIIDRLTGLPEIIAERDRLRKAHRVIISLPNGEFVWTARNISRVALAETESGEKDGEG